MKYIAVLFSLKHKFYFVAYSWHTLNTDFVCENIYLHVCFKFATFQYNIYILFMIKAETFLLSSKLQKNPLKYIGISRLISIGISRMHT